MHQNRHQTKMATRFRVAIFPINSLFCWCREGGSNPHGREGRRILSPLRLPVPPSRRWEGQGSVYRSRWRVALPQFLHCAGRQLIWPLGEPGIIPPAPDGFPHALARSWPWCGQNDISVSALPTGSRHEDHSALGRAIREAREGPWSSRNLERRCSPTWTARRDRKREGRVEKA